MVLVTPVFGVRAPQLLAGRAGRCGPQRWREASGGRGARDYCLRPGEWPEGGGVAGGLRDVGAPPAHPQAFPRPDAQASGSWRALGPAAPVPRAWPPGVLVGCVPPPPAGGPAQPFSVARRVLNGLFSGSSLETRRFLCSTSSLTGQRVPCVLVAGYFYFSAILFFSSRPQMILSQRAVA